MKQGFLKVAAITPKIKVADCKYNAQIICDEMEKAYEKGAKIIVFPELCITGYTCGDLFLQESLLEEAKLQLSLIAKQTEGQDALVFVGLPFERDHKLYNVAAVIQDGCVLGMVPKKFVPNYGEFSESRYFQKGNEEAVIIEFDGEEIPFGTNILFESQNLKDLCVGCEIAQDACAPNSPAIFHVLAGATVIVNLAASGESVGKDNYRELMVKSTSAKLVAGYIYCSAGEGESTQDIVFSGHKLIAENGVILSQNKPFAHETIYADLDLKRICSERRKLNIYEVDDMARYLMVPFEQQITETQLEREFYMFPFVPADLEERANACARILAIQSYGLKKRYEHVGCKTAIIGVSGGLDSTLALLATVSAFDLLNIDRKNIFAVTMPCFGTTDRTYDNACRLSKVLGVTLEEVDIKEAVTIHFRDIKQDINCHDVTYENSQARERTQILMDLANRLNGLVIGTGDLSELVLGWATYNGDHMSMYGVNAGIPKTLLKHLVKYYADTCNDTELRQILLDVLDTPVSPELLPPVEGRISQKTEELVGPYELHDFFLYYILRFGYEPIKVYRIAKLAFQNKYSKETILKWLKTFYRRFFNQQFKRSCLPDGPKVGSVALSPRGALQMPSDASSRLWLEEVEKL